MPAVLSSSKAIERKAEALLTRFKEPPIPVNVVAQLLGLEVEPADLGDDVSGILVVSGDRGVIGFNKAHPLVRQRFTIAHEIAHFVLHRSEHSLFIDKHYRAFFRNEKSAKGTDWRERAANAFAAALLMPEGMARRAAKVHEFELGDEDGPVEELARAFQVSTQAMTFRLVNLGIITATDI
jgi:Zn-dependent peptidase ImmA (M78 family)